MNDDYFTANAQILINNIYLRTQFSFEIKNK